VSALPGLVKHPAGSPPKWLLREAGADALTDAVTRRAKTGFTLPIGDWMRRELREPCTAAVDAVAGLPFMEGREVHRVWNAFLADGRAYHWSRPLAIVTLGTYLMRSGPS